MKSNTKVWKRLAVAGLAAALLLIGAALQSGLRASRIQGPGTLGATPHGELWLQVDDELWRLSPQGELLQRLDWAATGLPGRPSHLVQTHDGAVLATVRDDDTLYLLDPDRLRLRSTLHPMWPADLQRHAGRAITPTIAADGRIAIATGGGHAVALFDAHGHWLATTPPGTYRFTNGLWWEGPSLWTTDTNRFQLKRLDGQTLALQQTLDLPDDGPAPYLGLAAPAPASSASGAPQVALTRLRNGMIDGRVVLIDHEGRQIVLPGGDRLQPADLLWVGDTLVASDGASFRLLRWSAAGRTLPDFGDAPVREGLQQARLLRQTLQRQHDETLAVAVAVFVAAFGAALQAHRLERQEAAEERAPAPAPSVPRGPSPVSAALASALIPGLGQWWQRRQRHALLLFVSWAVFTLAVTVPLLWTVYGPRAGVAPGHVTAVLLAQFGLALLAAADAWQRGSRT